MLWEEVSGTVWGETLILIWESFAKHLFTVTIWGLAEKSFALKTKVEWGSSCTVPFLSTNPRRVWGVVAEAGICRVSKQSFT